MTIFRNIENTRLYTITHLIKDIKHLNCNGFAGIYAAPYKWQGEEIKFLSKDNKECDLFVKSKFEIVAEN